MSGTNIWGRIGLLSLALAGVATAARADVSLPQLISDHMVLQQGRPVRVWGTAAPGEQVRVSIRGKSASAVADADGAWLATLPALAAGGPFEMTVKGRNTRTVKDVLIGEVWVCSGQSNMEWPLAAAYDAQREIARSADDGLRMFTVTKATSDRPEVEVAGGAWQAASPSTSGGFSAVGYYFAQQLRRTLGVPVGVIHTSWGGTRIEAWTSRQTLEAAGAQPREFLTIDRNSPQYKAALERRAALEKRWKAAGSPAGGTLVDAPSRPDGWAGVGVNDADWKSAPAPAEWDQAGAAELDGIDGAVWFRRTVDVPTGQAGKPATLTLGAIDDYDVTYVNGQPVGKTDGATPNAWTVPRRYTVPAGVLTAGRNTIAVRIFDGSGGGGFVGSAAEMTLTLADGTAVPLAGPWKFKVETARPVPPPGLPGGDPNAASALYNAMLAPLAKATVTGAIWYQGESNAGAPMRYRAQLPAMIADWRRTFQNPDLYFFASQLAPFVADGNERTAYAEIREAESMAAEADPKRVGVAVITDVGEERDIHPKRKGPVGQRLALLAEELAYGQKVEGHSPHFREAVFAFDKVLVRFDRVAGGLRTRSGIFNEVAVSGDSVLGFQIAGADGVFSPGIAKIVAGDTVEVRSSKVPQPKKVRYGFVNFPVVNLFGGTGLPVEPFRSDRP